MRVAHQPSRQSCVAWAAAALCFVACASNEPVPSIWPPPDFSCQVEEVQLRDGVLHVVRRVRFEASGVVVYGTSQRSLVDPATATALPVFDRLTVYELVPSCMRALARRIDRLGITKLDAAQGQRGATDEAALVMRWRAFGSEKVLTARGRVHGPMAEILAVVIAHLPPGERLALPGTMDRVVVPVLRGVPEPAVDAGGALLAHEALLTRHGEDAAWLLDAYALACALGQREVALGLLRRWGEHEALRRPVGSFPDAPREGLTAEILRRLLPPAGPG